MLAIYVAAKSHRAGSSSILPPSLLNSSQKEGLTSKCTMFPFPSLVGSRRDSPVRLPIHACHAVCPSHRAVLLEHEGHVSPCRHLLWFGLSWQEQLRIEEPCDCRISTKSVLFATVIVLETTLLSILSKSIPKFYLIGRSGAGMSWCLWVSPPASGTNKTSSTK